MLSDDETFGPRPLRDRPRVVVNAFREDEDLVFGEADELVPAPAAPPQPNLAPLTAAPEPEAPSAMMERLEREATLVRFRELDRRSEELAVEQQRLFAERLDAAIAAQVAELRQRRAEAESRLGAWEQSERARIAAEIQAEEQEFGDRLMRQLHEFEAELGARAREQELKLEGWWREAERLADQRMRAAIDALDATAGG